MDSKDNKFENDKKVETFNKENDGVVGNPSEQEYEAEHEHSTANLPPKEDPAVYPTDQDKKLTPDPLPAPPSPQDLSTVPTVVTDEEKRNTTVKDILDNLLHISNIAHHAGNQFDVKTLGHIVRDFANLMHRMISAQ